MPFADVPDDERWNRNVHYHSLLLGLGPPGRVLDVGCGGGLLARQFALSADEVVGIDPDMASIEQARRETTSNNVSYVEGDVLTHPFERASFDLIVSVAAILHFDAEVGLRRFDELLRPGGTIGIIGIGRDRIPQDLARRGLAQIATTAYRLIQRKNLWSHSAPIVWPPPHTEPEMRAISTNTLPGSTFRRHIHGRYSITWTKPE